MLTRELEDIVNMTGSPINLIRVFVTTPSALVEELRAAGVPVESLSDLVNAKRSYRRAVPVLLDWLQKLDGVPAADRTKVPRCSYAASASRLLAGSRVQCWSSSSAASTILPDLASDG